MGCSQSLKACPSRVHELASAVRELFGKTLWGLASSNMYIWDNSIWETHFLGNKAQTWNNALSVVFGLLFSVCCFHFCSHLWPDCQLFWIYLDFCFVRPNGGRSVTRTIRGDSYMDDPRSVLESNQIFFIKRRSSSIDAELPFSLRWQWSRGALNENMYHTM